MKIKVYSDVVKFDVGGICAGDTFYYKDMLYMKAISDSPIGMEIPCTDRCNIVNLATGVVLNVSYDLKVVPVDLVLITQEQYDKFMKEKNND